MSILKVDDGSTIPLFHTEAYENTPMFSPDCRWIAYTSDESGRDEIFVSAYPNVGKKWQISNSGGKEPLWRSDGRVLYYRNNDAMMSVAIQSQKEFSYETPKLVFKVPFESYSITHYDYDHLNNRFIMLKQDKSSVPRQINIVLNWVEELKRIVSSD